MALIELSGVSTVFGRDPLGALGKVRAGTDKASLLAQTGHTLALHDIHLDIEAGEIFVIMGLSGCGKSTLVRHLNRLVEPTAGEIRVDGEDVLRMSPTALRALRRDKVSMVFQHFGLHAQRTVLENVALALECRGMPRKTRERAALHWLDTVELADVAGHYPLQLSGGMQQRVGLARALAADTPIILMDEAFSALDPLIRAQMQQMLLKLQAELNKTVVFISHDLDEALKLGNRIAILKDGQLVQVGTPEQILTAPANDYVAAFVAGVNRTRVLRAGLALAPWPTAHAKPALEQAFSRDTPLEQLLPALLASDAPLALHDGRQVVGQLCRQRLRALLAPAKH